MTFDHYILNENGEPKCTGPGHDGLIAWAQWWEANREKLDIGRTWVGESLVCTTFLGLDYNWRPEGPPILWETEVSHGPMNGECQRCSGGREQAEAMHAQVLAKVKSKLKKAKRDLPG